MPVGKLLKIFDISPKFLRLWKVLENDFGSGRSCILEVKGH